jgi:hypothetical protein
MYTAPEVIASARSSPGGAAPPLYALFGPPADCWAFGLTAFQVLTGVSLFKMVEDTALESDEGMDDDDRLAWDTRYLADAHAEWVRQLCCPL